jgi:choice-of-anchor A domain-containing protein
VTEHVLLLSDYLAGLEPTGTAEQSSNTMVLRGDGVSDFQVFSIELQQLQAVKSLHLDDIAPDATVFINVGGEGTIANTGIAFPGWLHDRVLFNFYEATSLAFKSVSLKGSVLAPFAGVTAEGGVIFGNVIVDTWNGSVNVGKKPFAGTLPECEL